MANQHKVYMQGSPSYRQAFEAHGGSVPLSVASRWTGEHGFTLADLIDGGDLAESDFEHDGTGARIRVHTLALWVAMGY